MNIRILVWLGHRSSLDVHRQMNRCEQAPAPLFLQDAGSQQVGFLLGSCGVSLALTTDACQKGLPKAQTGEVVTFKGGPMGGEHVAGFSAKLGPWASFPVSSRYRDKGAFSKSGAFF